MTDAISQLMGAALTRVILAGAGVMVLWTAWNGYWQYAAGLLLALGYLFYLSWRSIDVNDHLIDPKYWDR